jgi:hypothetical protein
MGIQILQYNVQELFVKLYNVLYNSLSTIHTDSVTNIKVLKTRKPLCPWSNKNCSELANES